MNQEKERTFKVLVVDDHEEIRVFFATLLTKQDADVVTVDCADAAMEALKKNKFDLAFIDFSMPGKDGLQLYREMRASDKNIKVIMMMDRDDHDSMAKIEAEPGISKLMLKPFYISEFETMGFVKQEEPEKALRVLAVDDDSFMLAYYESALNELGCITRTARNGVQALDEVKRGDFDLIFLDVILPDESGIEVYQQIKNIRPNANIVMVTGYRYEEQEVREKLGNVVLFYKPIGEKEISAEVERIKKIRMVS